MAKIDQPTESELNERELELRERKEIERLYDWFESGQEELPDRGAGKSPRMTASEYNAAIRGYDAETTLRIMKLHTRLLKERRERIRREKNPS